MYEIPDFQAIQYTDSFWGIHIYLPTLPRIGSAELVKFLRMKMKLWEIWQHCLQWKIQIVPQYCDK